MANGFLTAAPGARHGNGIIALLAGQVGAQRFACPGSGTQEISEIGAWWAADAATTSVFRLAIFTHDAANNNPDAMVANSESAQLSHNSTAVTRKSHAYATKPRLAGGTTYWLAFFAGDANGNIDRLTTGGVSVGTAVTYPTWPTGAQWDAAADSAVDFGVYAVYNQLGLVADAGSIVLTGIAAGLRADRKLAAVQGAYAFDGVAARLLVGHRLAAAAGAYVLTGVAAGLRAGRKLAAARGVYNLLGQEANLIYSGGAPPAVGTFIPCYRRRKR